VRGSDLANTFEKRGSALKKQIPRDRESRGGIVRALSGKNKHKKKKKKKKPPKKIEYGGGGGPEKPHVVTMNQRYLS